MIKLSVVVLLLAVGGWQLASGSYILAKAQLAQYLIADAWAESQQGEYGSKPWAWADTWPVARLTSAQHNIDLMILHGSNDRTLAFGPGHMVNTPLPGTSGNSVVGGHRDTHFGFLADVARGDEMMIETVDGRQVIYRVTELMIVDHRNVAPVLAQQGDLLTLVTCYPFDTMITGGPLRYVVKAQRV